MRHILLPILFCLTFTSLLLAQSQEELDWANAQYLNGTLDEEELHEMGFGFTDEDEDSSTEAPVFTDGIFRATYGQERLGFAHSTGTKQYLWIRCTFSDTDHRSGSPNSAVINNFNQWLYEIQRISYQQFGIDRLTILNMELDVTYQEAKDNGMGPYLQPKMQELRDDPQLIFDAAHNYYRKFVPGQDDPSLVRIHLDSLYDSSNPNHWKFTANTNGGSWVAGIGGKNISGGDTNVAFVHELGHNFGLGHEPRLLAQYGPGEKQKIGHFMPNEHNLQVSQNGTYTVRAYGMGSSEKEGLKMINNDGSETWMVLERHHKEPAFETGITFRGDAESPHRFVPTDEEQAARAAILEPTPPILVVGKTMYMEVNGLYITPTEIELDEQGRALRAKVKLYYRDDIANQYPTLNLESNKSHYQEYETIRLRATASDMDDDTLYYHWHVDGKILQGWHNSPELEYFFEEAGLHIFTCTVSDGRGGSISQQVSVEVGDGFPSPTLHTGQIVDTDGDPVAGAEVHLAQQYQAVADGQFVGLIDEYVFDEQHGLNFDIYEDWSLQTPTTQSQIANIDYPDATGPTANDVFKAQWNGTISSPTGGMYLAMPIDAHRKVRCRIIIDLNQDNVFDPDPTGADLISRSVENEDFTNIVFLPQGDYDFRLQYSDAKGSGTVNFPFRQFGIYADLTNANTSAGSKIFHDRAYALTDANGNYQLQSILDLVGQQIFVDPYHNDYTIDRSDLSNITLTKKKTLNISHTIGGTVTSKLLMLDHGDSTLINILADPSYKIDSLLWNGAEQSVPASDDNRLLYMTPEVVANSTLHIVFSKQSFGDNLLHNSTFDQPLGNKWQTAVPAIKKGDFILSNANPLSQIIDLGALFTAIQLDGDIHAIYQVNWDNNENDGVYTALRTGMKFYDANMQLIDAWDRGTFKSPFVQHTMLLPVGTRFAEVTMSSESPSLNIPIEDASFVLVDALLEDNITTQADMHIVDLKQTAATQPVVLNQHTNDKYHHNGSLKTMKKSKSRLLSFNAVQAINGTRILISGARSHLYMDTLALQYLSATDTVTGTYQYTIGVHSPNADNVVSVDNSESCTIKIVGKNDPPFTAAPFLTQQISLGNAIQSVDISQNLADVDQGAQLSFSSSNLPTGLNISNGMLSGTPTSSGQYSIELTATDEYSASHSDTLVLLVENTNLTINLSQLDIDENNALGQVVAELSSNAAQASYSIDMGQESFYVDANMLKANAVFNYENQSTHTVSIQVTDLSNNAVNVESFTIQVNNLDDAPSTLNLSNNRIKSDQPSGTAIGQLSSMQEEGLAVQYSLLNHTDKYMIDGDSLRTAMLLSYNSKVEHEVQIRATTSNGLYLDRTFTVVVDKRISPIENITYSGLDSIYENADYTFLFGKFDAVKGGDNVVFELIDGAADNSFFALSGDSLRLRQKVYLEEIPQNPLVISVRGTDENGHFVDRNFEIHILPDHEAYRWIGVADSNWHNPANWNHNTVPTPVDDIVITGNTFFQPLVSQSNVIIRSIKLMLNAALSIDGYSLELNGF